MKSALVTGILLLAATISADAEDLGHLSENPFLYESTANPFGAGSPFAPNGINNSFSPYGSPFSNKSATNPFATEALRPAGQLPREAERQPVRPGLNEQSLRPVWLAVFRGIDQQPVRYRKPLSR